MSVYDNLSEIVDPSHTCLVVWDVQNGLVNSIFNQEQFLQNLGAILRKARESRVPIIYTRITPLPPPFESGWRVYQAMKRFRVNKPEELPRFMEPGSQEAEIHASVQPAAGDIVLNKHTASIFIGTHFEYMMRNRSIETILFTGIATEIGVESSARDAGNRGFYNVVVSDCVSSASKEMHEMALKVLPRVCLVVPAAEIAACWQ
jgi:nicotinamidase-related amidase